MWLSVPLVFWATACGEGGLDLSSDLTSSESSAQETGRSHSNVSEAGGARDNSTQSVEDGSSLESPITVSAKKLIDENKRNPLRFRETYWNKWVRVTGTVAGFRDDSSGLRMRELSGTDVGYGYVRFIDMPGVGEEIVLSTEIGKSITLVCLLKKNPIMTTASVLVDCHPPNR